KHATSTSCRSPAADACSASARLSWATSTDRYASWEARMTRKVISSGSPLEAEIGYSRAVVEGDWIFVSGTTGFDYRTMTVADDVVAQTEQCLQNIVSALTQAGG